MNESNLAQRVFERTKELERSETQMRLMFETSPNGIVVVDSDGEITRVNSQMADMFGYRKEEMLGRKIEVLMAEGFRQQHIEYRRRYQEKPEIRPMGSRIGLYGLKRDGTEFPVEIGLAPLTGAEERCTMATIIDISELQKQQRSIEAKNEQLSRLNQELIEFAYCTSHDLKAPLASITGLLEFCVIDLEQGDDDEVRANLKKCRELAERLGERVESSLELAKSDMASGEWEQIFVAQRIRESWNSLSTNGISLEASHEHLGPIKSVPGRFDAIVDNLLSNAIKYRDPEKPENKVFVKTWVDDDNFYLEVKDNGVGIAEEYRNKVFRLFHRLAGQANSGIGLGLPMVKKSVTRLGGTIELEDDDGWTSFNVTLPRNNPDLILKEKI